MDFLDRVFSKVGLIGISTMLAIPVLWPFFNEMESRYFPVVTVAELYDIKDVPRGQTVWVRFKINRQCKMLGLNWYTRSNFRIPVEFPEVDKTLPRSRPKGEQDAGPWTLVGMKDVRNSRAVVTHRCHFLWDTQSVFYTPEAVPLKMQ